jgi:plastocyanin
MRSHHRLVALLILTFALGLAACGGGNTAAGQPTITAQSGHCPASAGLPSNTSDHGTVAAAGHQLAIEANDFFFSATCQTRVPSGTLTLMVHNAGQALHNVSIPSLNVDMDVSPGQTITVQVRMESAPLVFFCKYHKSVGMYGALLPSGGTAHGCCCCCGSASGCAAASTA